MNRSTVPFSLLLLSALFLGTALLALPAPAAAAQESVAPSGAEAATCQEKKARYEEMRTRMEERDKRLDELVATMNGAKGDAKIDAVAAVVAEMIAQRKEMRAHMHGGHGWKDRCCAKACGKCEGKACAECAECKKGDCPGCAMREGCCKAAGACTEDATEGD